MVEAEEGAGSTRGRTGAEEKRRREEKRRGAAKLGVSKQKGRSKCPGGQLEQVNRERDLEKDREKKVTGGGSPPLPQLLPPPPTHRSPQ